MTPSGTQTGAAQMATTDLERRTTVKPNWISGRYAVVENDELIGYFRQFRSAWAFMDRSSVRRPDSKFFIMDKGAIVLVRESRGSAGNR
jgi:hypothetical protein